MSANNLIAEGVETHGVRTFSAKEMAFNILGLMHPLLFDVAQVEPVWADLNGGMDKLPDLAEITLKVRQEVNEVANVCSKISLDNAIDYKVVHGIEAEAIHHPVKISPRANFTLRKYVCMALTKVQKELALGSKSTPFVIEEAELLKEICAERLSKPALQTSHVQLIRARILKCRSQLSI